MDENRIIELLARKMAAEATLEELDELDELIRIYPDTVYYEELFKELWLTSAGKNTEQPDAEQLYLFHQLKFQQDFAAVPEENDPKNYDAFGNLLGIAIGIMTILLISFACWTIMGKSGPGAQVTTRKDILKKIKLPDSSQILLHVDSGMRVRSGSVPQIP